MLTDFLAYATSLPAGLTLAEVSESYDGVFAAKIEARNFEALTALGGTVKVENSYTSDTLIHSASASIDDSVRKVRLTVTFAEKYEPVIYSGRVGETIVYGLTPGVQAYKDATLDVFSERAHALQAYGHYFFRIHPTRVAEAFEWAKAQGIELEAYVPVAPAAEVA
jgi:hypothetical protein